MTLEDQNRKPNFESNGKFFLVRCFNCEPSRGKENYGPAVASGTCAWCGWSSNKPIEVEL